jgi:hypothetical protein
MTVSIYGIGFATKSKMLRRVIAMDHEGHSDAELGNHKPGTVIDGPTMVGVHPIMAGESMLIKEAGNSDHEQHWNDHVFKATGTMPPARNCAAVDHTNTGQALRRRSLSTTKVVLPTRGTASVAVATNVAATPGGTLPCTIVAGGSTSSTGSGTHQEVTGRRRA